MTAYIAALNAASERDRVAQQAALDQADARVAEAARERLTPLKDRLGRLLASIPLEVQQEGLSLSQLQSALRGRWRGNCHPGELGEALRKTGFTRRRRWGGAHGFQALWFPGPKT